MALREELEKSGNWLFRWRSYLPLLILPLTLVALRDAEVLERLFGETVATVWDVFCIIIAFVGLFVRILTVGWVSDGTSGRNTTSQVAASLNTEGFYSVARHPLYFGNFLIAFGLVLFVQVWWFAVITVLIFWLYYERIMFAEEAFLRSKFGEQYEKWAMKTPAFVPNFSKWKTPQHSFSMKMVLKREYVGFFGIIASFIGVKFLANLLGENELKFRLVWVVFLAIGGATYLILRYLRKYTKVLSNKQ